MDICEKLRWMADKYCNELIEAAEEIERLRKELKSYSSAVESLDAEVTAQRRAANEHRNAAMEADLRTQAAVRGEKQALAEVERLRARLVVAFATCTQLEAIACDFTITRHPCGTEDFTCGCEQMMTRLKTPNAGVIGA